MSGDASLHQPSEGPSKVTSLDAHLTGCPANDPSTGSIHKEESSSNGSRYVGSTAYGEEGIPLGRMPEELLYGHEPIAGTSAIPKAKANSPSIAASQGGSMRSNVPIPSYKGSFVRDLDNDAVCLSPQGTPLYRLCHCVPFLLGPKSLGAAIKRMSAHMSTHGPPATESILQYGFKEDDRLDSRDMSLIALLILLVIKEENRGLETQAMLLDTWTQDNYLVVYKDLSPSPPFLTGITVSEFADLYRDWTLHPNPARVANDRPYIRTPWSQMMEHLRERNISLDLIDADLYFRLTDTPPGDGLNQLLERTQADAESGELLRQITERAQSLSRSISASASASAYIPPPPSNTFSYTKPADDQNVLYANRFSHTYPKGRVPERESLTVATATRDPVTGEELVDPKLVERLQQLGKKKKKTTKRWTKKAGKYTLWGSIIVVVLGGVLATIFFKMGDPGRNKFDP